MYELGKQFRNEGIDADHNPEFTTCEFYQAYANLDSLFEMTEDMLQGKHEVLHLCRSLTESISNASHAIIVEMAKSVTGSSTVPYKMSNEETVNLSFKKPFRKINIMEALEEKIGAPLPDLDSMSPDLSRYDAPIILSSSY